MVIEKTNIFKIFSVSNESGIEHLLKLLDVREHVPYEIGLKTEEDISPVSMIGSATHVCTELFREYSLIKIELSNENTLFLFF